MHCYRMLGSLQDAEDALQETMTAAWQGLKRFEERASIRTWLYRIATNRCLNARRSASRRPAKEWDIADYQPPEPTRFGEIVWLEPFPDALLEGVMDVPVGPEARYEQAETMSLAFVTALQVLPPRQLAVLVLRDVLGFHANEVAEMLESTTDSINSLLKRARAGMQQQSSSRCRSRSAPAPESPSERATVAEFVRAYESGDLDALVALLTDDVFLSMPPFPLEYEGIDVVTRFYETHDRLGPEVRPRADASQRSASVRGYLAARPASARTGLLSSRSPATGSARSRVSKPACSHGSGCPDRSRAGNRASKVSVGADPLHRPYVCAPGQRLRRWAVACIEQKRCGVSVGNTHLTCGYSRKRAPISRLKIVGVSRRSTLRAP